LFGQDDVVKNSLLTDKFTINAGVFIPTKNVNIQADGNIPTDLEEEIEFDEKFGLSDFQATFSLNFMWRFAKKWTLNAEYFAISNNESALLTNDVEWNDLTFKEGTSVNGGFGISVYKIFFGRLISTGDKHELGGGLGVHLLDVNAFLEGNVIVNDDQIIFKRSQVSVVAPLPNIGFWYIYAPTQKLSFDARVDWFGIKIGDFGGSLWNVSPGVNYQFFKNIGLSAHYKFIRVDVDVDKDNWKGNFNMSFSGPEITFFTNF
tara:strand:- start:24149 stop:24931 length:783 start_codon:yes stop_codon:yes gene_type:complete